MAELPDDIARINALTTNARNTWFALLSVLVFVGITLMGVEHIDFYGVDRATKLPLVAVEVPTRYFFIAAPILTAAIYGYFHLYLIRLWDVLGVAEPRHGDRPLGDVISPWLVIDAALHLRRWLRNDEESCTTPRTMEGPAMALNFLLAWAFGLIVLGFLWWQSMPARSFLLTGIAATALLTCLFAGAASLAMSVIRMGAFKDGQVVNLWSSVPAMASLLVVAPALILFSHQSTEGAANFLAPIIMVEENIVERPAGWLTYQIAHKEFRATWCKRNNIRNCSDFGDKEEEFAEEWRLRRNGALFEIRRADWHKVSRNEKLDFRDADLRGSFLVRANLRGARMERADLTSAQMEGANLREVQAENGKFRGARLEGAILIKAQMRGASFQRAKMEGANLFGAQMEKAILTGSQMERANLSLAEMAGADLRRAQLQGADLSGALLEGADLRNAQMQGADLTWAKMKDAQLNLAQMQAANLQSARMEGTILRAAQMVMVDLDMTHMVGADFNFSFLSGKPEMPVGLRGTNLSSSTNQGGAIRWADLTEVRFDAKTDFRNVFLDSSVVRSVEFERQMGEPCQWWPDKITDDAEFYGRWRGWIEHASSPFSHVWEKMAPEKWKAVEAISPPQNCSWKTDPMPDAGD